MLLETKEKFGVENVIAWGGGRELRLMLRLRLFMDSRRRCLWFTFLWQNKNGRRRDNIQPKKIKKNKKK